MEEGETQEEIANRRFRIEAHQTWVKTNWWIVGTVFSISCLISWFADPSDVFRGMLFGGNITLFMVLAFQGGFSAGPE